jgi:hypothetical protein
MKTTKSSGYDKISVKLFQAARSAIVEPLTRIYLTNLLRQDFFQMTGKLQSNYKSEEKTLCG